MLSFFKKNKKGQAVLFIILVFQVLFILFAMSLNVAMVVYDKINLQNSLDLASYYGAKKQSEVLNAMAHINYQMRQNWKLLAWRYRILGTVTQPKGYYHPDNLPNPPPKNYWCPQNQNTKTNCGISSPKPDNHELCNKANSLFQVHQIYPEYCDQHYFTCISNDFWRRGINTNKISICVNKGVSIQPIESIPVVAPFIGEAWIAQQAIERTKENVNRKCPEEGALNWLMTQLFLTHFRLDQKDRKTMIKEIYKKTLQEGKDLDGTSIFEGTQKVFFHNLTKANQKNVQNLPNYGLTEVQSFEGLEFKAVFDELSVRPVLYYLDFSGDSDNCNPTLRIHFSLDNKGQSLDAKKTASKFNTFKELKELANFLIKTKAHELFAYNNGFAKDYNALQTLSLSFYKKTDQILYYGLRAKFNYEQGNQIFSLPTEISFQASSFAKAFGASFGPQPEQSDPFIPTENSDKSAKTPLKFVTSPKLLGFIHQPNHSRWPGDQWGLIDKRLHDRTAKYAFLNKQSVFPQQSQQSQQIFNIENYFHVLYGTRKDPLAYIDESNQTQSFMRMMEWMAVYPDLYDIHHYSILGNYHETYFPKICKLLTGGSECNPEEENRFSADGGDSIRFYVRGDFGWPDSESYIKANLNKEKGVELSIAPYFLRDKETEKINPSSLQVPPLPPKTPTSPPITQYGPNQLIGPYPDPLHINLPLSKGNLFYPWLAGKGKLPDGLLSSWFNPHPLDYQEYEFDNKNLTEHFLNCKHKALPGKPVSSSCVGLGRTGYSIKLVSCESIKKFKPQVPDLDEFCPP